jgi:predicted nucleic-acid-binding Zn-ribbon protein
MSGENAEPVVILGRELKCVICGHDRFWQREAQLNTAAASFFNLDWTNAAGICVICNECGYIHWFYPQP